MTCSSTTQNALLCFHCNNGYVNSPNYYHCVACFFKGWLQTFAVKLLLFLVLSFLHGVGREFANDVSKTTVGSIRWRWDTAVSETSSTDLRRTSCKPPPPKKKKRCFLNLHCGYRFVFFVGCCRMLSVRDWKHMASNLKWFMSDELERVWKRSWINRDIPRQLQAYGGSWRESPLILDLSDFFPTWKQWRYI